MKKIFTIIGPTAVGKTNISIKIAKLIKGQVVGLDSRQIYKGMSIGTAQPNKIEMQSIVHHLVGERDPWKSISAGEYSRGKKSKYFKSPLSVVSLNSPNPVKTPGGDILTISNPSCNKTGLFILHSVELSIIKFLEN